MRTWNPPTEPADKCEIVRLSQRIKDATKPDAKPAKLEQRECPKGHSWQGFPNDDVCPFCFPNHRRLSEFGVDMAEGEDTTVIQTQTGSYTGESLIALERSHAELVEMAYYWAGRAINDADMFAKLNGMIRRATQVRKTAGLE